MHVHWFYTLAYIHDVGLHSSYSRTQKKHRKLMDKLCTIPAANLLFFGADFPAFTSRKNSWLPDAKLLIVLAFLI